MDTVYCVNIAHGGVIRNVRTRIIREGVDSLNRIVSEKVENRLAYPSRLFLSFFFLSVKAMQSTRSLHIKIKIRSKTGHKIANCLLRDDAMAVNRLTAERLGSYW